MSIGSTRSSQTLGRNKQIEIQAYITENDAYQEKLRNVSTYLNRLENIPESVFQDAQIKKELERHVNVKTNPELREGHREFITFYDVAYKPFTINCESKQLPLTLKVESKIVWALVYLSSVNECPSSTSNYESKYHIKGTKLIVIKGAPQSNRLHVAIAVRPEDLGLLTIVNLEVFFNHRIVRTQSQSPHQNYRSPSMRAARKKELDTFLRENHGMAKQILADRMAQSRLNFVAFNKINCESRSSSRISLRSSGSESESKRHKSRAILFEKQKSMYINHISKMNSQFPQLLRLSRKRFEQQKAVRVKSLCCMVRIVSFLHYISKQSAKFANSLYRRKRIQIHCKVFIRALKSKLRKKMMLMSKIKLSIRLGLVLRVNIIRSKTQEQARKIVCQTINEKMLKHIFDGLESYSLIYLNHIKRIQIYVKSRKEARTVSFQQLQLKLSKQMHISNQQMTVVLKSKQKQKKMLLKYVKSCAQKYKREKVQHSKERPVIYSFFRNRLVLMELISKALQQPKKASE